MEAIDLYPDNLWRSLVQDTFWLVKLCQLVLSAHTVTPALLSGYSIYLAVERCTGREHNIKYKLFYMLHKLYVDVKIWQNI